MNTDGRYVQYARYLQYAWYLQYARYLQYAHAPLSPVLRLTAFAATSAESKEFNQNARLNGWPQLTHGYLSRTHGHHRTKFSSLTP